LPEMQLHAPDTNPNSSHCQSDAQRCQDQFPFEGQARCRYTRLWMRWQDWSGAFGAKRSLGLLDLPVGAEHRHVLATGAYGHLDGCAVNVSKGFGPPFSAGRGAVSLLR